MSLLRIKAVLLQEVFITKHSFEIFMDLFFFSVMSVIVFGFLANFLSGSTNSITAFYLLQGLILWEVVRITQYSMSVGSLWNIWSRNLGNMFITPLSIKEYLFAHMLSGTIKSLLSFTVISLISIIVFKFNIFNLGWSNLILYFLNLTFFSWAIGIIVLGIIFRFGTRVSALAWGIIFLFQPLTAVFFPVSVLPPSIQLIANLLPPTHIFEAARINLTNPSINWHLITLAFVQNCFYLIISVLFFNLMLKQSKETGQFTRNEE